MGDRHQGIQEFNVSLDFIEAYYHPVLHGSPHQVPTHHQSIKQMNTNGSIVIYYYYYKEVTVFQFIPVDTQHSIC